MFLSATWGKRRRNCILTLTHSLRLVSLFRCKFNATQLLLLVFYLAYFWNLLMYSVLLEKGCSCIECLMLLSSFFFPMGIWQYFALLQGMLLFIYFFLSSEHSTIWKSSMVTPHPLNSHLTPSCSDQWTCNWRHRHSIKQPTGDCLLHWETSVFCRQKTLYCRESWHGHLIDQMWTASHR